MNVRACWLGVLGLLGPGASAQQFVRDASAPSGANGSSNVDLADVDLDGDWDAAFADVFSVAPYPSRLWINQGGAQLGVLGDFLDRTAVQLPNVPTHATDVEFADLDADGDSDLYLACTLAFGNEPSGRFWINQGGVQGGSLGYFVDETASRWSGLGGAGSSIHPSFVLAGGGFLDSMFDADFADLDDDGDLDLVHPSYALGDEGTTPSRVFLNDGFGTFSEFNPSGAQVPASGAIANGMPGLWCAGTQLHATDDASGTTCDIADFTISIDVGDLDGDFDLDLVSSPSGGYDKATYLQGLPRVFQNRLAENAGVLGFRDVTGVALPDDLFSTGPQESFGDFDGDRDWDLVGLNWAGDQNSDRSALLSNQGSGTFGPAVRLPRLDFRGWNLETLDFDVDGDLDVVACGGTERPMRNVAGALVAALGVMPADGIETDDLDSADVDGDGDPDLLAANRDGEDDWVLLNTTSANDTTAPVVGALEQVIDRLPGAAPTVVRAHVLDNASYDVTWYDDVRIEVRVNAAAATTSSMRSSRGQVFRGEIDGAAIGLVTYRVVASDEHANTGSSAARAYAAGTTGSGHCFGDGSGSACPCGNVSAPGSQAGCANSLGVGARLVASGTASVAADSLVLAAGQLPSSACVFLQGTAQLGGGTAFGDGLRCVGGAVLRLRTKLIEGGTAAYPLAGELSVSLRGEIPSTGGTRHYQLWYRNTASFCAPDGFNLTNGWTVDWSI